MKKFAYLLLLSLISFALVAQEATDDSEALLADPSFDPAADFDEALLAEDYVLPPEDSTEGLLADSDFDPATDFDEALLAEDYVLPPEEGMVAEEEVIKDDVGIVALGVEEEEIGGPTPVEPGITASAEGEVVGELVTPFSDFMAQILTGKSVEKGDSLLKLSWDFYDDYRFWPVIWLANREVIKNPELIQPGMPIIAYKLPFDAKNIDFFAKAMMADVYAETYRHYVTLGKDWTWQRRWVLLEALYFEPDFVMIYSKDITADDAAWYAKVKK
jgi:hypothetical protein